MGRAARRCPRRGRAGDLANPQVLDFTNACGRQAICQGGPSMTTVTRVLTLILAYWFHRQLDFRTLTKQ
jgi:hypothetical protein